MAEKTYPQAYLNVSVDPQSGKLTLKGRVLRDADDKGSDAGYANVPTFKAGQACGEAILGDILRQLHNLTAPKGGR